MFGLMYVRRKIMIFMYFAGKKFHIVAVHDIFHANNETNKRNEIVKRREKNRKNINKQKNHIASRTLINEEWPSLKNH